MRAVMSKRYKLVIHLLDSDEFYDLEKDPYEMNNLIDDETYTEIRNEMHDRLIEHMNSPEICTEVISGACVHGEKISYQTGKTKAIQDREKMKSMNQDS